jgi:hypothetical protein
VGKLACARAAVATAKSAASAVIAIRNPRNVSSWRAEIEC